MPALILAFLKSHWQTALIASGIAGVMATISLQHLEIRHLHADLAQCRAESVTLEKSNQALTASITSQNAAVAALQTHAALRQKKAAQALKLARLQATKEQAAAKKIAAAPATGDDCSDLKRLIGDFAGAGK